MAWGVYMLNLVDGKVEFIPRNKKPDSDDPRYGDDVHIIPLKKVKNEYSYGAHEFTRECYCRPEVTEQCHGRTLIAHKDTVN